MFSLKKKRILGRKIPGIEIQALVFDERLSEAVTNLAPGSSYGHIVTMGKYYALYTIPVSFTGSLQDTRQLWFPGSQEERSSTWQWDAVLQPDRTPGDHREVLVCSDQKIKSKENIVLTIDAHTISLQDSLSLEVRIG